jgi:hypothetical protein
MHADDGGVDHLDSGIVGYGKRVYDAAPDARPAPSDEAIVTGGVGAKMIRQIAPRCSGAQDPEYAIEDTPVVYPRNATWLVRQDGPDGNPFMISEFVAHDSSPQFWKFESRRSGRSQRFRLSAGQQLRMNPQGGRRKDPLKRLRARYQDTTIYGRTGGACQV